MSARYPRLSLAAAVAALWLAAAPAWARQAAPARDQAALVVDGVVREVFRSERRSGLDLLLVVEVSDANLGPNRKTRVFVPAPGEAIYVHARAAQGEAGLPEERSQVRLHLSPRPQGGYETSLQGGIEVTSRDRAPAGPNDPEPPAVAAGAPSQPAPGPTPTPPATRGSVLDRLGLTAETIELNGRIALRVRELRAEGPAAQAGIEKGDTIVGVGETPFASVDELAQLLRKAGPEPALAVLDVRTGRAVPVKVALGEAPIASEPAPAPRPSPAPRPTEPAGRTLGVGVEAARVDGRTMLRVREVDPGSAAARAGIEVDDVIAGVGNATFTTPEELAAAVRNAGERLTVVVIDHRTNRSVPVEVDFSDSVPAPTPPSNPPSSRPAPRPEPTNRPSGARDARFLGVVTEQTNVQLVPALKVVQVIPGSPAEKAGIEPGDVIAAANNVITIVPDLLDKAVADSKGELTLSVIDPRSGRKTEVKVDLGGR